MKSLLQNLFVALALALAISTPIAVAQSGTQADAMTPLPAELAEALALQINSELSAAYLYLALSSHFRQANLDGFARWFTAHFYEELNHARKMIAFVNDKGSHPTFPAVGEAKAVIKRPVDAFALAMQHEVAQTAKIHALYEKAKQLKAYDAEVFLHYFVREQVEEEALFGKYFDKLTLIGDKSPEGLLALDRELGARAMPKIEF